MKKNETIFNSLSLILTSSAFAGLNCPTSSGVWKKVSSTPSEGYTDPQGMSGYGPPYPRSVCQSSNAVYYVRTGDCYNTSTGNKVEGCGKYASYTYSLVSSCPSGQTKVGNVCTDPNNPIDDGDDTTRDMEQFDGDEEGCNNAGGYYLADSSCNSGAEVMQKMYQNPYATVGSLLTVGGVTFGGLGLVAVGLGAAPVTAVTAGTIATVAGLGSLVYAGASLFPSSSQSSEIVQGEQRIKINLTTSGGSSASQVGSNITKTNTTSNKVDNSTFVPETTKTALNDPSKVNKQTGELTSSIPLGGMQNTSYDYDSMTATTVTHQPDSTTSNPKTITQSTPITVTQNPDGSVTTIPYNQSIAPVVSSSSGGSVVTSPTGGTGSGSSTSNGGYDGPSADEIAKAIRDVPMNGIGSMGDTGEFDDVDTSVISDMVNKFDETKSNLQGQIDSAKTALDSAESLVNGGWTPPSLPVGQCGTALQMHFNGKLIDLCPPLIEFAPTISPIITFILTIGGIGLAIFIFLGGF